MIIAVRDLTFRYTKAKEAVHAVSFSVERGEVFGLLGRNGSGKSTVLGLLAHALPLQGGQVSYFLEGAGARTAAGVRSGDPRRRIGVVFQNNSLDLKLTCAENLRLAARLYGLRGATADLRVTECLALAGLSDKRDDAVLMLSGGMRRRLDLARALVHEPALLLLDEPSVGLDEASFRALWDMLDALRVQNGLTVVLATHRPEEADRCGRVAIFHDGRITAIDTPVHLRTQLQRDVVVLKALDAQALREDIAVRFALPCMVDGDEVLVQSQDGHLLIPKIVEALPRGALSSVGLRQATMADVFLQITGSALA